MFYLTNLKFYKRCFVEDPLRSIFTTGTNINFQKHFCAIGWCLVRMFPMPHPEKEIHRLGPMDLKIYSLERNPRLWLDSSNDKTVKKQTFHKHSTNVPTSNRNETKKFAPKSAPSKEHISIWSRRADSRPNQNNLFSTRQIRERYQNVLDSFPKRYRNVCLFVFDITTR